MSFLVSFKGQFTPYVRPAFDAWHEKISPVNSVEGLKTQSVGDPHVQMSETHHPPSKSISAYQHQSKSFETAKKRIYAKDIMSSPVHSIQKTAPIDEAIKELKKFGFRHLVVVEGNATFVGLLSDRELLMAQASDSCEKIMVPKIIVAMQTARIPDIAHIMLQEKINALPIIDDHYQLVGIITQTDILKYVIGSEPFSEKA